MKPFAKMPETLKQAAAAFEVACELTLLEAGAKGVDVARNTDLFKNIGALRDATNFHQIDSRSGFVLADKKYAQYLEDGNPFDGFIIKPVRAKALHFRIDGEDIFVKSAKAHGPLPFMQNAQDAVEEALPKIFEDNLETAKAWL